MTPDMTPPTMPERVRRARAEAREARRRHIATRDELRHVQQERDRLARAARAEVAPLAVRMWSRAWRWLVGAL